MPVLAFAMFQLMFAVITTGADLGRDRRPRQVLGWRLFVVLWATIVYFPVAHWVFSFDGFVTGRGRRLDRQRQQARRAGLRRWHRGAHQRRCRGPGAGLVLGKRRGWPREPMRPHNLPFVLLGAGLLWFGWFGFNAGSALGADGLAAVAFINTMSRPRPRMLGWLVVEQIRDGKPTTPGCRVRCRRRPGRDHPACSLRLPAGRDRDRPHRRRALCARRRPEVPLRLRRLARRRRRPPRRRSRRHPADRLLRHHGVNPLAPTACSTAAASTSCGARRRPRSRCWSTRSCSPTSCA